MKVYKAVLLFIGLLLFAVPALSHHNPYTHYKSGLSISIGNSHSSGLRLHYSNPSYSNYNKYYSHRPVKGFYNNYHKQQKYLGSHYSARPYARTYKKPLYKFKTRSEYGLLGTYPQRPFHKNFNRYSSDKKFNRHSSRYSRKACHPVTKIVTDSRGYYQSLAGTMCYDNYGQSYIVPGSRYSRY